MRTAPLRSPSYDEIVMKSMLTGSEMWRIRSAMKHVTPLSTPIEQQLLAGVVLRDLRAELVDPALDLRAR